MSAATVNVSPHVLAHVVAWSGSVAEQLLTEADRQGITAAELVREVNHPPRFARFLTEQPEHITVELIGRCCDALGLEVGAVLERAFIDAGPVETS